MCHKALSFYSTAYTGSVAWSDGARTKVSFCIYILFSSCTVGITALHCAFQVLIRSCIGADLSYIVESASGLVPR